jgi:hypothetical protein
MTDEIDQSDIDAWISRSTVAFVYVDGGTPEPMGSGTLVHCRTTQGIVTCAHVLDKIKRQKQFGVMCFAARQNMLRAIKFDVAETANHAVEFWNREAEEDGPDIAFIPIPKLRFGDLTAVSSPYDLDLGKDRASRPPPEAATKSFVGISGIVGEMTPPAELRENSLVLAGKGIVNAGEVVAKRDIHGIQVWQFRPVPGRGFSLPKDYRGTSGGGLWLLYLDDSKRVVERRLNGIAFYQRTINDELWIDCHGPGGIYDLLLTEIYKQWAG